MQQNSLKNRFLSINGFLWINKYIFYNYKRLILIDLNKIFSMKPSEFKISHSVESYDKKKLLKIAEISTMPKST